MIYWPEMLRHAEEWANGFWAGAVIASLIGIAVAAVALARSRHLKSAIALSALRREPSVPQEGLRGRVTPIADAH